MSLPNHRSVVILAATTLVLLSACRSMVRTQLQPIEIAISHTGGSPTTIGDVHASYGQKINIKLTDTEKKCYTYNATSVPKRTGASGPEYSFTDTVEFRTEMRDTPLEITIEAIRIDQDPRCNPGGERRTGGAIPPWKIQVLREGWDIAFTGAFTGDTVTTPKYALVPGQKQLDPASSTKTSGFFVRSAPEQEDSYRLGAAAMVNVFHTGPGILSWNDIGWTPISFGLGVGEASQVRYFLGTGVRFGDKFFLSLGSVVGSVRTLPTNLIADNADDPRGFTTDANALSNGGSKTETGFYIGVSYTFAGVGPSSFTGPFAPVKPAAVGGTTPATPQQPKPEDAVSLTADVQDIANKVVKYEIVVANSDQGADLTGVKFKHDVYNGAGATSVTTVKGSTGASCPQGPITGNIEKTFDMKKDSSCTFEVTTTFTTDTPATQNLLATLEHTSFKAPATTDIAVPKTP